MTVGATSDTPLKVAAVNSSTGPPSLVSSSAVYETVRLGIVCPMANEAETAIRFVEEVLNECLRHPFADVTFFAVLDLVSRDETRALLETHASTRRQLRVVWAPETTGVADAYVRGYREALGAGCDWILEIDAGFSHDPAEIGRLFEAMLDDQDCVFGSRFIEGGTNDAGWRRRFISRGGTIVTNLLLGTRLTDMTSGFELFSKDAMKQILDKGISSKGPFFQTEVKAHCRRMRVAEVPIRYHAPSHHVRVGAIRESFLTLARLCLARLRGPKAAR